MNTHTSLSGTVALMHWGVIRAQGVDAVSFLQGQLTQDVAKLGAHSAALAGYCSPKGRLLASFVICKPAADEVLLLCHYSVLAATLKRLQMFVMRAKCKLTDATAELPLFGAVGDAAIALFGDLMSDLPAWGRSENCLRLPDAEGLPRVVLIAPNPVPVPSLNLDDWKWLEVRSAIATIEVATVDQFVPQMLNYEQLGGVNFQKGCYPGQEIVARSQFRGTIKRRAYLFETDGLIGVGVAQHRHLAGARVGSIAKRPYVMPQTLHLGREVQELAREVLVDEQKLQDQAPKAAAIKALV